MSNDPSNFYMYYGGGDHKQQTRLRMAVSRRPESVGAGLAYGL